MFSVDASVERLGQALARAEQHWSTRHGAQPDNHATHGFTVAISREAGTPGTSVARELGARLHWPVYDHELVEHIAQQLGVREGLVDSIDERRKDWLLQCLEAFGATTVTESAYVKRLSETIFSLAAHGQCIIVGRGAANILPTESTLRVRLIGCLDDRIDWVGRQRRISRNQAADWIAKTERDRLQFVRSHFFKDPADLRNYHLVLNTSLWTVPQCAELIREALRVVEARMS
jgi:cytidylate kinase